jgi:hypothetical protein
MNFCNFGYMKNILFSCFLIAFCSATNAQDVEEEQPVRKEKESDFESPRDRYYIGGDLNFWYSNVGGIFNISPMFGYKLTKGLMVGAGLTYQFTSGYDFLGYPFKNHMFGGRGFIRQDLFKFLFINAEYETYYTKVFDWITAKEGFRTIPVGNVGLGFKRAFTDRSYYQILVQYDLIGDRFTSIYVYPLAPISIKLGVVLCLGDL